MTYSLPLGAFHLPGWLTVAAQRALVDECRALLDGTTPGYVPRLRNGSAMRLRMLYLGHRDNLWGPPLPDTFRPLASEIAAAVEMRLDPDICIVNQYSTGGRLGLHQDKDESARSLAAGIPVVSLSLGDTADFLFGGVKRDDPMTTIALKSGDAFVFGGPARLNYHGVARILPGTAPPELQLAGRINLTFRQLDVLSRAMMRRRCTGCGRFYNVDVEDVQRLERIGFLRTATGAPRRCEACGDILTSEMMQAQRRRWIAKKEWRGCDSYEFDYAWGEGFESWREFKEWCAREFGPFH